MTAFPDTLLIVVLLLNLFILGTSRIYAIIRTVSTQGAILGLLPLILFKEIGPQTLVITILTILLKGIVIPRMLFKAMREVEIKREVEPLIGFQLSMILGTVATAGALWAGHYLPLAREHVEPLLVPGALATFATGFLILVSRIKAITQVMGFLVLENGIYLFGLLLSEALPFIAEIGVLLDLLVAIFLVGIIVEHMKREFSTLDTSHLTALKE